MKFFLYLNNNIIIFIIRRHIVKLFSYCKIIIEILVNTKVTKKLHVTVESLIETGVRIVE